MSSEIHSACLRGDVVALQVLLQQNREHVHSTDSCGNTPLHLACMVSDIECTKLLVEHGANVNSINKDSPPHSDGSIETGGRTPLHYAAVSGNVNLIEYLLKHDANPHLDDLDFYSPFELYFASHENPLSSLPPSLVPLFTPSKNLDQSRLQRKQVLLERKKLKKKQLREYIYARYTPKYSEIFTEWRNDMFHKDFLEFSKLDGEAKNLGKLKELLDEVAPRVYAFNLFSVEYCRKMLEELENFETSGLPQSRPNSMNNYGVILDDIGFDSVMQQLVVTYIKPMASLLFSDFGGKTLESHHAFMVRYKLGEDLDLKTHIDDAEVTINVCLGKKFTGSTLYFKGFPGKPDRDNTLIEYHQEIRDKRENTYSFRKTRAWGAQIGIRREVEFDSVVQEWRVPK